MESQDVINGLIGVLGVLFGYILNGVRASVNALHNADTDLTRRVHSVEVLVAGDYLRRDEYHQDMQRLYTKLDSIESKMGSKADK